MHLTDVSQQSKEAPRGTDDKAPPSPSDDSSHHTLSAAAQLLKLDPSRLKQDPASNIRGGAALLAKYAKETVGKLPDSESDWYGAVAKYSGSQELYYAQDFADIPLESSMKAMQWKGATWFSERLYRSSAALVHYLAEKYDIPLDRAHIIGHNEIPGLTPKRQG
ncbi:hypothetical protein PMJ11TS3_31880 [Paenibacillus melissococcoides]